MQHLVMMTNCLTSTNMTALQLQFVTYTDITAFSSFLILSDNLSMLLIYNTLKMRDDNNPLLKSSATSSN